MVPGRTTGDKACNTEYITIASIRMPPVIIRTPSAKLAEITATMTAADKSSLPHIRVGRVRNCLYPIDDPSVIVGLEYAGIREIRADVTDFSLLRDLVVRHIRETEPGLVDPVRIRDAVEYLAKDGVNDEDVCQTLWPDRWRSMLLLARSRIEDGAREVLLELGVNVAKMIHPATIPDYYLRRISNAPLCIQKEAAMTLKNTTMRGDVHDASWSWRTSSKVEDMVDQYKESHRGSDIRTMRGEITGALKRYRDTCDASAMRKERRLTAADIGAKPLKESRDLISVPNAHKDYDLMLHRKTRKITKLNRVPRIYKFRDSSRTTKYFLSPSLLKFLSPDDICDSPVHAYCFDCIEDFKEAVSGANPGHTYVVLTNNDMREDGIQTGIEEVWFYDP